MEFELGDKVKFSKIVEKKRKYQKTEYVETEALPGFYFDKHSGETYIDFRGIEVPKWVQGFNTHNTGIISGKRSIVDYSISYEYEYGVDARALPDTRKTVYLVSYHLWRSPVMVLPEHLERIESD
jgi:hypothetical protein